MYYTQTKLKPYIFYFVYLVLTVSLDAIKPLKR